ncbi:MAG TPA: transcriptional repressor LexA [Armatimonadota bacterium]|nr:transcriptional repressor LexA [Armatimonadota bacterium]
MTASIPSRKLTARQREVLEFVINFVSERGFPPSIREIGSAMQISSLRGVTVHLDALERKGWIRRENASRGIQVLAPVPSRKKGTDSVPVLGTIAAGVPMLAVENIESYISVPEEITGRSSGSYFALRVKGDSMIGDGILPGDLVVIRSQRSVSQSELAAVLIEDEATVKRVRLDGDKAVLVASNPNYDPIIVDRAAIRILGKVAGLVRCYDH